MNRTIAPDLRTAWLAVRPLPWIGLGLGGGLEALAFVELTLGWIDLDRFVGMLFDGLTVTAASIVVAGLLMAWSYVRWLRANRRMRRFLLDSLGGAAALPVEGRTGPVDATGLTTPAHPGPSIVVDLDQHRGRR